MGRDTALLAPEQPPCVRGDVTGTAQALSEPADPPRRAHDAAPSPELRQLMSSGWSTRPQDPELAPERVAVFAAARRRALSARFPGDTLVVPTGREQLRCGDTDYEFRPGSDYTYLVGAPGPEHVLVMHPVADGGHRAVVYLPPRADRSTAAFYADARHGELWIGPRAGLNEVAVQYEVETAPISALHQALAAAPRPRVIGGLDLAVDAAVPSGVARGEELANVLADMRLIKDEYEIACMEDAVRATVRGFADVRDELATATRVPRGERWLEGTFWRRARTDGNDVGYSSVVACGQHSATLHWQPKTGPVRPGDLLLLDMGVETDALYTADITRTVPVSGTFTAEQRTVYDAVLRAQQAGIDAVRPGAPFLAPHRAAMRVCIEFLQALGLLTGVPDDILETQLHRRWTLHGTSHHLGLDVHDCIHASTDRYRNGVLEPGMIITVEPGLYFQPDDELVPDRYRGIGVRIEDDILVTPEGARNLSDALPRHPDDVEAWMAQATSP